MADGTVVIEIQAEDTGYERSLQQVKQKTLQLVQVLERQLGVLRQVEASGSAAAGALQGEALALEQVTRGAGLAATAMGMLSRQNQLTEQLSRSEKAANSWAGTLSAAFSRVRTGTSGVIGSLGSVQGAMTRTGQGARTMAQSFSAQAGTVASSARTMAAGVLSVLSSLPEQMKNLGRSGGNGLGEGFRQGASSLTGAAKNALSSVYALWQENRLGSLGQQAAGSLAGGISAGAGAVSAAAAGLLTAARAGLSGGGWYGLGYQIAAGTAQGIRGGSGLMTAAAKAAAAAALSAAKKALGVHSPSRVFREQVGWQIPAGMAQGIREKTPEAERALEASARSLTRSAGIPIFREKQERTASPVQQAQTLMLETPVYLNGREIARASAKYQGRSMAYLEGL